MLRLNEELLQFIWRYKLIKPVPLISTQGNEIFVLKAGELNMDSGPDFFNAQIHINNITLVGNIEIHLRTSDWLKHNHQYDKSYDNIILHAVYEHDVELPQNTDNHVEVLELKKLIDEQTLVLYEQLATTKAKLPCASQIKNVEDLKFINWMERMTIERLEEKVKRIEMYFEVFSGDYTQTFYTCLLRNFGFKVNAVPFELLAKQIPVYLLLKHSDNLMQLEALLMGMSGFLEDQFKDKYILNLQNEFEYLKQKYKLSPLKKEIFKFSKLRPANFPTLRLAQFANLIYINKNVFTRPQDYTSYAELMQALQINLEGYWKSHYKPDGTMSDKELNFGKYSAENIIINTFAPFFFFYSKKSGKPEYNAITLDLLNACKMESNAKTRLFHEKKSFLNDAAGSQAIVNLYDKYCVAKQCLKCGIAASILNPAGY